MSARVGVATMSVWGFPRADGADNALEALRRLEGTEALAVLDAALVSWPEGRGKPRSRQLRDAGGTFWGMLFGLAFFVPFLDVAIGEATVALADSMRDLGIDDGFLASMRAEITPGTSALFILTPERVADELCEALPGADLDRTHTNAREIDERQLWAAPAFG
jgi:uncharacterized membrane protein